MRKFFLFILFASILSGSAFSQATANVIVRGTTTTITNTDTTQVIAAVASKKTKLTSLTITNASEDTGTWVNVLTKNTLMFTVYVVAQGGATVNFPTESPLVGGTNQAIRVMCETTGTEVRVSASGYQGL